MKVALYFTLFAVIVIVAAETASFARIVVLPCCWIDRFDGVHHSGCKSTLVHWISGSTDYHSNLLLGFCSSTESLFGRFQADVLFGYCEVAGTINDRQYYKEDEFHDFH
jgi:hypothetical protein